MKAYIAVTVLPFSQPGGKGIKFRLKDVHWTPETNEDSHAVYIRYILRYIVSYGMYNGVLSEHDEFDSHGMHRKTS